MPVTDTVKRVVDIAPGIGRVHETPPREHLRAVQTPQAFVFGPLLGAHRDAAAQGLDGFTDDGALAEWAGLPVVVFAGDVANRKITQPADLIEADRAFATETTALPAPGARAMTTYVTRLGTGFDVHAFTTGDHVWLGGVKIPADRGVLAHSDGDVALHALTDALLGAIADGDIGTHFPPSDERWRGASSDQFLAHACDLVRARGGRIDHLDITVLAEAPRIGKHREEIRARIAAIAGVPLSARLHQGDDHREARLRRPGGGARRPGGRDGPAARGGRPRPRRAGRDGDAAGLSGRGERGPLSRTEGAARRAPCQATRTSSAIAATPRTAIVSRMPPPRQANWRGEFGGANIPIGCRIRRPAGRPAAPGRARGCRRSPPAGR